jgi:hypothetical protein
MSQPGFTLLTQHLRQEIEIRKLFLKKLTSKKGSKLNIKKIGKKNTSHTGLT